MNYKKTLTLLVACYKLKYLKMCYRTPFTFHHGLLKVTTGPLGCTSPSLIQRRECIVQNEPVVNICPSPSAKVSRALSTKKDVFPFLLQFYMELEFSFHDQRHRQGEKTVVSHALLPAHSHTADSQWAVGLMTLKGGILHFNQILDSDFA